MKRRGAAMVWACLLLLIGSMLVATLTSLGISYHKRSVNEAKLNQNYLTARSGAELVAKEIINKTKDGVNIIDVARKQRESIRLKFANNMGECVVSVNKDNTDNTLYKITSNSVAPGTESPALDTVSIVIKETPMNFKVEDLFLGKDDSIIGDISSTDTIWEWEEDTSGKEQDRDKMPEITIASGAKKIGTIGNQNEITLGEPKVSTYYYFEKGTYNDVVIEQKGFLGNRDPMGNIYIYIKDGAKVDIQDVDGKDVVSFPILYKPVINVFIIVENGGQLTMDLDLKSSAKPRYVYIYAKYGGVEIGHNSKDNALWYGGITCYDTEDDNDHNKHGETVIHEGVKLYPGYPANPTNQDIGGTSGGFSYSVISYGS